jgi:1,4-alpha-glucan branching enzyme
MLKKEFSHDRQSCEVTFELHTHTQAQRAYLCGDFNDWDKTSHPMENRKMGNLL